ncbi:LLM class flavin-dependent oxidoreductase [Cryptosporangium minutisporangium]|uniref:LLM class flavin-dependent oxidoreductase n=1 Tax=Cryptosporangium minutisporangium TaxID=113569 RepID=UPI0035EFD4D8
MDQRGRLLEQQLTDLRAIWRGEPYAGADIGPLPSAPGGPPILIGAFAPAALRRVARHGDGFLCAAPLAWAGGLVQTVRDDWDAAGRPGQPRLVCQINTAIGSPETVEQARHAIADYYAFTGRPGWGMPLSDPAEIADTVAAYRAFGADELVLYCYGEDVEQIDALAAVALPFRQTPSAGTAASRPRRRPGRKAATNDRAPEEERTRRHQMAGALGGRVTS